MDESKMSIRACTRCGVENDTVHWRNLRRRDGIRVGVFCAACGKLIEAEEQAALPQQNASERDRAPIMIVVRSHLDGRLVAESTLQAHLEDGGLDFDEEQPCPHGIPLSEPCGTCIDALMPAGKKASGGDGA